MEKCSVGQKRKIIGPVIFLLRIVTHTLMVTYTFYSNHLISSLSFENSCALIIRTILQFVKVAKKPRKCMLTTSDCSVVI